MRLGGTYINGRGYVPSWWEGTGSERYKNFSAFSVMVSSITEIQHGVTDVLVFFPSSVFVEWYILSPP